MFERDYQTLFGRPVEGMDIEVTVWAVNATTPSEQIETIDLVEPKGDAEINVQRSMFDPALGESKNASVVLREKIQVGETVTGPAVITENETSIVLPASRIAIQQVDGCIDVSVKN